MFGMPPRLSVQMKLSYVKNQVQVSLPWVLPLQKAQATPVNLLRGPGLLPGEAWRVRASHYVLAHVCRLLPRLPCLGQCGEKRELANGGQAG